MSQFIYLLNAMEGAAQSENPFETGYSEKRRAVLEYVAKLEAVVPSAGVALDFVCLKEPRCKAPCGGRNCHVAPSATLATGERLVIEDLIAMASALYFALDDSEDRGAEIVLTKEHYETLGAALDRLKELPDDKPGYTMGPASKAAWALRRIIGDTVTKAKVGPTGVKP